MKNYKLSNGKICIEIHEVGAELYSLKKVGENDEYMWHGDDKFWNRTSPILFPVVGSHKDFKYIHQGIEYDLGQHGFARDMIFEVKEEKKNEIWFRLEENEETKLVYPFAFCLELGYILSDNEVKVVWKVINTGEELLHFSIGGHPGFMIPEDKEGKLGAYLHLDAKDDKVSSRRISNRLAIDGIDEYTLENGTIPITKELFAQDALVLEDAQVQKVQLLNSEKIPYLEVGFTTPIVGIWAPSQLEEKAPFVCIEPWHGRCDHENFSGELKDREHAKSLEKGKEFEDFYTIKLL